MKPMRILVWDLPARLFHWLLAASFAGAFLTAESERYRDVHVLLGYTVLALLAFRLVWAFVGSRYARLSSFAFGPTAVMAYLSPCSRAALAITPATIPPEAGRSTPSSCSGLVTGVSGYATYKDIGGTIGWSRCTKLPPTRCWRS